MNDGILNNREIASLVWTAIALVWASRRIDLRGILRSLGKVVRRLMTPVLLVPFLAYLTTLAAAIAFARSVGLWTPELIKSTILWTLLTGVGLYFSVPQVLAGEPIARRVRTASGVALVAFEVVVNFASFPLVVELVVVPLIGLGVMITAYAEYRPVEPRTLGCVSTIVALYGFAALAWTGWVVASEWDALDVGTLWREVLLPVWLTLTAAPAVYGVAVFAYYDSAFSRIDWSAKGQPAWRQKAALVSVGGMRLSRLRAINGLHHMDVARKQSFREARSFLRSHLGS